MCHLIAEFCENQFGSFCIILHTNKQTNADENTTSLAEVIISTLYPVSFTQQRRSRSNVQRLTSYGKARKRLEPSQPPEAKVNRNTHIVLGDDSMYGASDHPANNIP